MIPAHLQSLLDAARGELGAVRARGPRRRVDALDQRRRAGLGRRRRARGRLDRGRRADRGPRPARPRLGVAARRRPLPLGGVPAAPGRHADGADDPAMSLLTVMAGVAAVEAIDDATGVRATLKWPNDVVVEAPGARAAQAGRHPGRRRDGRAAAVRRRRRPRRQPAPVARIRRRSRRAPCRSKRSPAAPSTPTACSSRSSPRWRGAAGPWPRPTARPALLDAWRSGRRARRARASAGASRIRSARAIDGRASTTPARCACRRARGETRLVAGEVEWA